MSEQGFDDYYFQESFVINNFGVHVFPHESTDMECVSTRQEFAIKSYLANKISEITIFSFGKKDPKIENTEYININDINHEEIKCDRDYYFLGDILNYGLKTTKKDDYIIYTNSDCFIGEKFYEFILSSNYDYIEFFRLETKDGVVVGQNKDGIDGFAIKNHTLEKLLEEKILPQNLILGAPYWDAIFSNIARKYIPNKYQDTTRLFHTKHAPRWSFTTLDYAGKHNLSILNNLYENGVINCRKAEIKSDNLVIRILDGKTDFTQMKNIIADERFGKNKIIEFDFNYLFVEKQEQNSPQLSDQSIGTTAGTRYFVREDEIEKIINYETSIYKRYVILKDGEILSESTKFISENNNLNLGIVFCFFGDDDLRIKAAKRAIEEFKQQTIWKKSKVVFVELIDECFDNFDFSSHENVIHLKIEQKPINKNLFQKECLWNIGAQKILKDINNLIFIDIDTFPQNKHLFAKANKILYNNPNIIFQLGNCIITQKEDGFITRVRWLYSSFSKLCATKPYCFNPCGGFAISKKIFLQINGFNSYGFLYGGDILFLYEIDERTHSIWNNQINNMKIFKDIPRKLNSDNIVIENEDSPLIHCWHGNHEERPYHVWGMVFNELDFNKDEITIDQDGLLSWSNNEIQEKYTKFFKNKKHIRDLQGHKKLFK